MGAKMNCVSKGTLFITPENVAKYDAIVVAKRI